MKFFRYVMIFLLIYAGIAGLYFLNTAFSNADKKKAIEYVKDYHEGHTLDKSLYRYLKLKSPTGEPLFESVTDNTVFGIMKVKASLVVKEGNKTYLWKVDVVRNIIWPEGAETETLMKEYDKWK